MRRKFRYRRTNRYALGRARASGRRRRRVRRFRNARTGGYSGLELKFKDFELDSESFTGLWAAHNPLVTNCLSTAKQGTAEGDRTGRSMWIRSIQVTGELEMLAALSQATPQDSEFFRLCLVLDKQTNGAEVVGTDVMKGTVINDYLTFPNLESVNRYKILWDRTFAIHATNTNEGEAIKFANPATKRIFSFVRRFNPPLRVDFDTSADPPTVAQVTTNSLSMIGIGTDTNTKISYIARIRFKG